MHAQFLIHLLPGHMYKLPHYQHVNYFLCTNRKDTHNWSDKYRIQHEIEERKKDCYTWGKWLKTRDENWLLMLWREKRVPNIRAQRLHPPLYAASPPHLQQGTLRDDLGLLQFCYEKLWKLDFCGHTNIHLLHCIYHLVATYLWFTLLSYLNWSMSPVPRTWFGT